MEAVGWLMECGVPQGEHTHALEKAAFCWASTHTQSRRQHSAGRTHTRTGEGGGSAGRTHTCTGEGGIPRGEHTRTREGGGSPGRAHTLKAAFHWANTHALEKAAFHWANTHTHSKKGRSSWVNTHPLEKAVFRWKNTHPLEKAAFRWANTHMFCCVQGSAYVK